MRHSWIIIDSAITVIFLMLAGMLVFFTRSSNAPVFGGVQSYTILSGSMSPAIPVGSIVLTRPASSYGLHDVITYSHNAQMVTHRIVAITGRGSESVYTVKGDANAIPDTDVIPIANVRGKVTTVFPYLGILIGYIRTPFGFFSTIVLPGILFIALELYAIHEEYQSTLEHRILTRLGLLR